MSIVIIYLFCAILGYLFGAFPTGYFAGRLWNVDVRKHGSGRTGGSNVLRSAGWGAFVLTVSGDVIKGIAPVLVARTVFPTVHSAHALALLGVLVGHNWSIWIAALAKPDPRVTFAPPPLGWIQKIAQRGRGGAGVATTAGACLALYPPAALAILPIPILILIVFRYSSVASMTAAALFPFIMLFFVLNGSVPISYLLTAIIVSIIVLVVHLPNMARLRAGTERRFGQRLGKTNAMGR